MFPWLKDKLHATGKKQATHFYIPTKSYLQLSQDEQAELWIHYCDSVANGQNPNLYEVNVNKQAIQLGFDMKLSFERQQIPYNNENVSELVDSIDHYVQHVIGTLQSLIPRYFQTTEEGTEFISCYLRRDDENVLTWTQHTVDYVGRIIFPYARIDKQYITRLHHYILNELQLNGDQPNEHLSHLPINGLDTFIQPYGMNDQVELYTSTANSAIPPLILYEIYGYLNTDTKTTYELTKIFVPSFHTDVQQGIISQETMVQKVQEHGLGYWLPLFFSSGFFENPLQAQEGPLLAQVKAPKVDMNAIREEQKSLSKLERARQLLAYISIQRVDQYWSWIDIGQALNAVDSGDEGLQLWKWITTQSDYKTEEDCEMQWYNFEPKNDVNIETLEHFARQDNPKQFEAFSEREQREAIDHALSIQENIPVAKAFKACFPHEFVCANYQQSIWYYYNQHRWNYVDGQSLIIWYLTEKFMPKLDQLQAELSDKKFKSRDNEFRNRTQQRITQIGELIRKLSRQNFLKGVCDAAKIYYHKPNFNQLKDSNPHYTATPSGVIDVRGGQETVRSGKPQDYVTRCTRFPYPHAYHWDHKAVKMTMDYLHQVFRSVTMFKYFLRFSASLLLSGNSNKIFPIFSGQGNNSKSMLVKLFEFALGNYAVKLPTSLITEKRTAADAATPTLIHSQGAKVAFLEEPNKNEVIQSGTVKHMTGRDTQYVRDLFQKGSQITEMDVTITPILIANKIPAIPDCQEAIWNRTRVLEFLSKWTANAPDDPAEQFRQGIFKMDRFFDNKIPLMAPAFLWIMVQTYSEYIEQGLNDPKEVLQATENFRVMNNYYIHFTRDCVTTVLTETGEMDTTAEVNLSELFNSFKQWWKVQENPGKIPTKTEFKGELEITWKTKADADNKWYGMRLNEQKNTIESLLSF